MGTLAEHGSFLVIMTFPIFGLKSQTLASCLRTSVVLAIFLFSETGFPSLMIECADDVALRVAVTHVTTSKPGVDSPLSDIHELGTPLSFRKGFQAFMALSLGHAVPGILSLGLPSVMQMEHFH